MKKSIFSLAVLAAAGMAFTSCSDDAESILSNDGQVTFTVAVPGLAQSRAFADGTTAQENVNYYVYDQADAKAPVLSGTVPMADLKGQLTLSLATAHTYDVVFLATASGAPYTYDQATRVMTADYTATMASDEKLDAFYAVVADLKVTGPSQQDVKLYRPFAQLNIGTNDVAEYQAITHTTIATTEVAVSGIYPQFDLMKGDVAGTPATVTFKAAALPGAAETFPVKYTNEAGAEVPYTYLAMDYLLVNQTKDIVEVAMTVANADGTSELKEYSNIPVQRNFRTNIYGRLLTAATDFNVEIKPGFTDDINTSLTVAAPETNADGVYLIKTQGELAWLAEQVNGGNMMSGKTFSLQNDIFMSGKWTPIGVPEFGTRFSGKFLGNGHTIHNMVVDYPSRAGFFGFFNGQVDDLNFDNATVSSNHWAGVVAGYSDNETGSCHIKGCNVTNSSVTLAAELIGSEWDNGDKGGLIIGYMATADQVENCSVKNCTLQGYRDLGGIIGYSNRSVIRNNSVDGLTITVDNSHNYKNYTSIGTGGNDANPVIGEKAGGTDEGNTSANVTIGSLVSSQDGLAAAFAGAAAEGETTIYLAEGTYTLPNITSVNAVINICGNSATVIKASTARNAVKELNFRGVTIKGGTNYTGFQHVGETTSFTGCTIDDFFFGYSPNLVFDNCVFNYSGYALWTYAATKADFTGCTFNGSKDAKAILVYCETSTYPGIDVNVTDCTFTVPADAAKKKGVIQINTEQWDAPAGTVTIKGSTYTGAFTGWVNEVNNISEIPTSHFNVVVE